MAPGHCSGDYDKVLPGMLWFNRYAGIRPTGGYKFLIGIHPTTSTAGAWGNYFGGFNEADQDTMIRIERGIAGGFLPKQIRVYLGKWQSANICVLASGSFWRGVSVCTEKLVGVLYQHSLIEADTWAVWTIKDGVY